MPQRFCIMHMLFTSPSIENVRFAFDSSQYITNMTAIGCLFDLYWSFKGYIVIC